MGIYHIFNKLHESPAFKLRGEYATSGTNYKNRMLLIKSRGGICHIWNKLQESPAFKLRGEYVTSGTNYMNLMLLKHVWEYITSLTNYMNRLLLNYMGNMSHLEQTT